VLEAVGNPERIWVEMDRNDDAIRRLEAQVNRLEGLLTGFEGIRDDVMQHGQELAALKEWRQAHDAAESKRAGRMVALVGLLGAFAGKVFDWLHGQYVALMGHTPH
jgi:hypothetical protein